MENIFKEQAQDIKELQKEIRNLRREIRKKDHIIAYYREIVLCFELLIEEEL